MAQLLKHMAPDTAEHEQMRMAEQSLGHLCAEVDAQKAQAEHMLELDNLRRHMTGLEHELVTPSRKLVHAGALAVWFDELDRRRNLFFVLMSDMLIVTKRKSNEQEMGVLDVAFTNQICACTADGERILQIVFDCTTLAGREILDCELQSTSDRDHWLRLLKEAMASCAVQDVEAGGGKRASIRISAPGMLCSYMPY